VTLACPAAAFPPARLQADVEASLRALRLDAIPLVLLPLRAADRARTTWPEQVGTCARLVREGKVLAWGASLAVLEDDTPALCDEPWLSAVHVPYSLCEREAEAVLGKRVAVLAARPLAGGALAGALGPGARLPPADDRRAIASAQLERIAVGIAKLAAYVKREPAAARSCDAARAQLERNVRIPERECETVAELALRYVIDRGAIALPRLHRREHVPAAIAAAAAPALRIEPPTLDT
jgi:aryl-alcohol dehydrogenase-like predicted oxidoreductase